MQGTAGHAAGELTLTLTLSLTLTLALALTLTLTLTLALPGMRQEIRRLTAPPTAAALEKVAKANAAKEAKQAGKEAAQVDKDEANPNP